MDFLTLAKKRYSVRAYTKQKVEKEKLDAIVEKLGAGNLSLDEMVKLYEEGMILTDHCRKLLEGYEGRLMQVNARMQIEEIQE